MVLLLNLFIRSLYFEFCVAFSVLVIIDGVSRSDDAVAVHRARLLLGWVTDCHIILTDKPSTIYTTNPTRSTLYGWYINRVTSSSYMAPVMRARSLVHVACIWLPGW